MGQRVVSNEDGFQTLKVGDRVDDVTCVKLNDDQFVASWQSGYQTCAPDSRIDRYNVLILDAGDVV